jgi:hypothetical protein
MGYQGGWTTYPDKVVKPIFSRSECTKTKVATIKSGQVLKAYTWLESDGAGKLIAHGGITESALVTINGALAAAATLTVGTTGIVFTVGSAGATIEQLVNAMSVLVGGDSTTTANAALLAAGIPTTVGTFTSGTAPAFNFNKVDANTVVANATTSASNVTDLAVAASAGTAPTVTKTEGTATFNKIAGMTVYDVNATAGDVDASVFIEAAFYAQGPLWAVDTAVDTVANADGTTTACTTYNTGCAGTSAASNLLKQKFIEGSEFTLDVIRTGEVY